MGDTDDPGDPQPRSGTRAAAAPAAPPPAEPPPERSTAPPPSGGGRRRVRWIVAGLVVLLVLGAAAFIVLWAGDDGGSEDSQPRRRSVFEREVEEARSEDSPDDIRVPDPEEPDDLGDDPLLDRLADECFDGDPSSCDDLFRESFVGSEYEKYGSTCGDRTKRGQAGACAALYPDPDYASLRRACEEGDDRACDDLYTDAPRSSVDEHFGSTCGGRSEDELAGDCAAENP